MIIITIHLNALLDAELRRPSASGTVTPGAAPAFREFQQLIAADHVQPSPLFPDTQVVGFAPIWHVAVPDQNAAALVARLAQTPGVEAAYSKPDDALPSIP